MIDPRLIKIDAEDSDMSDFKGFWYKHGFVDLGPLSERVAEKAGTEATKELRCVVANLVLAKVHAGRHGRRDLSVILGRRAESFTRKYPDEMYRTGRAWTPRRRQFVEALDALEAAEVIEQLKGKHWVGATEIIPGYEFDELLREHAPRLDVSAEGGVVTLKGAPSAEGGARQLTRYDAKLAAGRQARLDRINAHVESFTYAYTPSERESGRGESTEVGTRAGSRVSTEQALKTPSLVRGTKSDAEADRPAEIPPSAVRMSRIFHTDGGRSGTAWGHGRFYSIAQSIPGRDRHTITIDGEPTVELDISGLTPTILYHLAGLEAPADAYYAQGLDPEYRAAYKVAMMIVFNARSRKGARLALWGKVHAGEVVLPPDVDVGKLFHLLEQAHAPIAKHFYTGAGRETMKLDAKIAEKVMLSFVGTDAPCISVHDGFIVPERAEERLYRAIVDAYASVVASDRKPRVKATYADGSSQHVTADTYRRKGRA